MTDPKPVQLRGDLETVRQLRSHLIDSGIKPEAIDSRVNHE